MASSVAGLMTSRVRPESAGHHLPSMYIFLSVAVAVAVAMMRLLCGISASYGGRARPSPALRRNAPGSLADALVLQRGLIESTGNEYGRCGDELGRSDYGGPG